jgi:competence protein ComEC
MTFLSIGQGDSILIESNDLIMTIDGGSSSNKSNGQYILSPHLKSRAIDHIDFAYITHADSDHTNGIIYLLENENDLKIKNLILPITAANDKKFDKIRLASKSAITNVYYMKEEDVKSFKENLSLIVLSPNEEQLKSKKIDQNEMSLTFRLDYNNHSALFTGDIGLKTMNRMLKDNFAIKNMDVDILKVPHHGSKNSNFKEFFDLVSPKYSVFSYGKNNNYGHPNQETVDSLLDTGSKILKTGESGQIDIYLDKNEIEYFTFIDKRKEMIAK